jgi:hypothetical protein
MKPKSAPKPPPKPNALSRKPNPERPKKLKARPAEAAASAKRALGRNEVTANNSAVAVLGPQVVLKIRRRKFNQQQHHAGEIS